MSLSDVGFFCLVGMQFNGPSSDKQDEKMRREVGLRPAEVSLSEEHTKCVTGTDGSVTAFVEISHINVAVWSLAKGIISS